MIFLRNTIIALFVALLSGCASGANSQNMTASLKPTQTVKTDSPLYRAMTIANVTGGSETNPLLMSQVSNTDFNHALKASLNQNNLYTGGAPKYNIVAVINAVDQPIMGLDMSVTSKIHYKVVRNSDNATVYDKVIPATYTAELGDSLLGTERLRLANEGSIRKNIEAFIAELSQIRA